MEERSLNQKTKQKKSDERFNKEPFIPNEMVKALMPFILQAIDDLYYEDDKGKKSWKSHYLWLLLFLKNLNTMYKKAKCYIALLYRVIIITHLLEDALHHGPEGKKRDCDILYRQFRKLTEFNRKFD